MKSLSYKITLTETAVKSLRSLSGEEKNRIFKKIEELETNPLERKNVKKLVDFDIAYSMRVGDYRVLFERDDKNLIIDVIDIRHRKESYRRK